MTADPEPKPAPTTGPQSDPDGQLRNATIAIAGPVVGYDVEIADVSATVAQISETTVMVDVVATVTNLNLDAAVDLGDFAVWCPEAGEPWETVEIGGTFASDGSGTDLLPAETRTVSVTLPLDVGDLPCEGDAIEGLLVLDSERDGIDPGDAGVSDHPSAPLTEETTAGEAVAEAEQPFGVRLGPMPELWESIGELADNVPSAGNVCEALEADRLTDLFAQPVASYKTSGIACYLYSSETPDPESQLLSLYVDPLMRRPDDDGDRMLCTDDLVPVEGLPGALLCPVDGGVAGLLYEMPTAQAGVSFAAVSYEDGETLLRRIERVITTLGD